MDKEKLVSLVNYLHNLTNKLDAPIPTKHAKRPETYKQFLLREISAVKSKLDKAKLEGIVEKK